MPAIDSPSNAVHLRTDSGLEPSKNFDSQKQTAAGYATVTSPEVSTI